MPHASRAARALLIALWLAHATVAGAQVVFDDTFGPSGTAPTRMLGGQIDYMIDPSRGALVSGSGRSNLFHSFSQFDVPLDQSASFLVTDSIDTVIARVTGGSASLIDGQIRGELTCASPPCAGMARADLFFINPAGVLFGESANLDLPGSFHVTSADSLRFADGVTFESAATAPSVTAAAPEAFGFLAGPSGDIEFDRPRPINVAGGETLSVVGGNVAVRRGGVLIASGGRIHLGAAGEAQADIPVDLATWSVRGGDASMLGEVVVGQEVAIDALDLGDPDGDQGRIVIRGGRFIVDQSDLFAGGIGDGSLAIDVEVAGDVSFQDAAATAFGFGSTTTGGIRLSGDRVEVRGGIGENEILIETLGPGGAGAIEIDARELFVDQGAALISETFGAGQGAAIRVAADIVEVADLGGIRTRSLGSGFVGNDAGEIRVEARDIVLRDGGQISASTEGSGRAGDVSIVGADTVRIDGEGAVFPSGIFATSGLPLSPATGDAGLIRIETGDLLMTGGGQISARTFGTGNAGQIEIVATGRVALDGAGVSEPTLISTRGFLGEGGSIDLSADVLELRDGGRIQSTADGTGDAGDLLITTRELSMGGRSVNGFASRIAAETLLGGALGIAGSAGRIDLDVAEDATLADGADISARSIGQGATNDITIDVGGSLRLDSGATINSQATFATAAVSAGDVIVTAGDRVELHGGSAITAQADGLGDAGNIEIRAASIEIDRSALTTNAATALGGNILLESANSVSLFQAAATTDVGGGTGQGGDIFVNAETMVVNSSLVTANARGSADAGNIQIATSDGLIESTNSRIEASAELGISGSVVVQGPNSEIAGELTQLTSAFLDAASQLEEACLARDAPAGSFEVLAIPALQPPPDALFDLLDRGGALEPKDAEPETCEAPLP